MDKVELSLNHLIRDVERLLRPLLGADVELTRRLAAELPLIKADPGQIEQILVNLAVNARDAMPDGGKLVVETAAITLEAQDAPFGVAPGPYVQLKVSDTGVGMSAEVQAHIFEPFFTTKEPGKGTGLGLATCYGIVEQHGGHIAVSSALGQGTTIWVYFPQIAEVAAGRTPETEGQPLPRGSETVLLVEDEAAVRSLAARVLGAQGYTVLEAGNGAEAQRLAQECNGAIDLVVTDVVMPQLGGPALVEQL